MIGYNPTIVTDGLVLYLDAANGRSYGGSGTTWSDLSGNGNNGTLTNGPTYSTGSLGSFSFDNIDDKVTTTCQFPTGSSPKSFSVWFKIASTGDRGWIIAGGSDSVAKAFGLFREGGSTKLLFHGHGAASDMYFNVSQNTTSWYNVVISYDGTTIRGYVNGEFDASKVVSLNTSATNVDIGVRKTGSEFFYGNISNVLIYNRVLSEEEIKRNFNATRGRFGI